MKKTIKPLIEKLESVGIEPDIAPTVAVEIIRRGLIKTSILEKYCQEEYQDSKDNEPYN